MTTVTLEEAQAHLPELIARLHPGEELVITRDQAGRSTYRSGGDQQTQTETRNDARDGSLDVGRLRRAARRLLGLKSIHSSGLYS